MLEVEFTSESMWVTPTRNHRHAPLQAVKHMLEFSIIYFEMPSMTAMVGVNEVSWILAKTLSSLSTKNHPDY